MGTYSGTITTTGKSEAIRLEKALFKSHPEFRQKTKVRAHVIGPGTMLVSVADEIAAGGVPQLPCPRHCTGARACAAAWANAHRGSA